MADKVNEKFGGQKMKELTIRERIIVACILFLIGGLAERNTSFLNFRISEFLEQVKQLSSLPKETDL